MAVVPIQHRQSVLFSFCAYSPLLAKHFERSRSDASHGGWQRGVYFWRGATTGSSRPEPWCLPNQYTVSLVSSLATTDDVDEISLVATFKGAHADARPQSFRHPCSANKGERGKHLSAFVSARAHESDIGPLYCTSFCAPRLCAWKFKTPDTI